MVKIKISYNTEQELERVVRLLSPALKSCRISRNKEGRYKKAYAELDSGSVLGNLSPLHEGKDIL